MQNVTEESDAMPPVRWLADEMLGRLARYLRFLGHDTEYVRGSTDREIAERATREGRILLTRDRALAAQVPGSVHLESVVLAEQLRGVRTAHPELGYTPRFDRCTRCNGALRPATPESNEPTPAEVPDHLRGTGKSLFRCTSCGHWYWEGSHTARVREFLRTIWGPDKE